MKYVILLGDGMADEALEELGGLTPLQHARTPRMDEIARRGVIGLAETVPAGFHPGSDVANLSVFGYDPATCYSGRSPLEAASMGVELGPDDVAFRLNLVTLAPQYGRLYMEDFSAGHITTAEARELIACLQEELGDARFSFHAGVSYRHLLVWHGGKDALSFTPPHDLTHQSIEGHLPQGDGAGELIQLTTSAQMLLSTHPVNLKRQKAGKPMANSIWLWGHGRAPRMTTLQEKYGLTGAVISAVDLIKGIGIYAGLDVIEVPGATGYIDTNYQGKAEAALEALQTRDFVYLHVEAPDEAAHAGNLDDKLQGDRGLRRPGGGHGSRRPGGAGRLPGPGPARPPDPRQAHDPYPRPGPLRPLWQQRRIRRRPPGRKLRRGGRCRLRPLPPRRLSSPAGDGCRQALRADPGGSRRKEPWHDGPFCLIIKAPKKTCTSRAF